MPKDLSEFPVSIQRDIDKLLAKAAERKAKAKQNKPA